MATAPLWLVAAHAEPVDDPREAGVRQIGDADGLQALEAFYGFDPASPRVREWTPFLAALSRNPLMRRVVVDRAAGSPAANAAGNSALADANSAVIQIVAEGLRRVDNADLLAARPLMAKMVFGLISGCREAGPDGVSRKPRLQIDEELAGLEPVLTRAVVALNSGVPVVAIDEADVAAANRRALPPPGADGADGVRDCDRDANAIRLRLQNATADTPLLARGLLRAYVESLRRPHLYAPGDAPAYPPEALRASIVGSQVVRFTVDASSRLETVRFVTSRFTPSTVTRPDGTLVAASDLFDAEIRAWLAAVSSATPPRFPAKPRDGVLAATTYELPFEWKIDAGLQKSR